MAIGGNDAHGDEGDDGVGDDVDDGNDGVDNDGDDEVVATFVVTMKERLTPRTIDSSSSSTSPAAIH